MAQIAGIPLIEAIDDGTCREQRPLSLWNIIDYIRNTVAYYQYHIMPARLRVEKCNRIDPPPYRMRNITPRYPTQTLVNSSIEA